MQVQSQSAIQRARIAVDPSAVQTQPCNSAKEIARRFLLSKRALDRQPVGEVVLRKSFLIAESGRMNASSTENMRSSFEALAQFAGESGFDELAAALGAIDATLPASQLSGRLPGLHILFFKGWCEFCFAADEVDTLLSFVSKHGATFRFDHY
ncbi:hypothetical protein [Cupriavidus sp. L7L]|uniref:hypothetical protein n=1 Tax=Cupriavidus sp. L7L TaxID=2546443 RepID=UPI00105519A1|nr:hypothetical protein [Cupriavidus sp. L7L]TDF62856.1 hypothetical protein E1J61_26745 [Cupriavidus sp. L7L]